MGTKVCHVPTIYRQCANINTQTYKPTNLPLLPTQPYILITIKSMRGSNRSFISNALCSILVCLLLIVLLAVLFCAASGDLTTVLHHLQEAGPDRQVNRVTLHLTETCQH